MRFFKASSYIPDCLYGDPEVAAVGLTEDQALGVDGEAFSV